MSTGASAAPKLNTSSAFGVGILLKLSSSNNTGSDTEFILQVVIYIYYEQQRP
jgi:hypothetical protein